MTLKIDACINNVDADHQRLELPFHYIIKATLEAEVSGVSLHPLIVKELRTNTVDFPKVNS